jgi:hypothetical protein
MLFLPFNADIVFNERSFNSFVGSINLSEVIQSTLKLIFDTPRNKVKVYSMNMNDYVQRRSEITSSQNTINTHLVEDFTRHSLMHVERRETSNIVNFFSNLQPKKIQYIQKFLHPSHFRRLKSKLLRCLKEYRASQLSP